MEAVQVRMEYLGAELLASAITNLRDISNASYRCCYPFQLSHDLSYICVEGSVADTITIPQPSL